MKRNILLGLAALSLSAIQTASALIITGAVGGAPLGTSRINFDDLALGTVGGTAMGPNGSVDVSFTPDGQTVMGTVINQYAAPWLSGGDGIGFAAGGANQANGADATKYLTTGLGSAQLDFGSEASLNYLGLLWGSVDTYNTLSFYYGATLVDSMTGGDLLLGTFYGDQNYMGTLYVNVMSEFAFNRVVASSSQYAFEFDNVAYGTVPDGGLTIALMGMCLTGLSFLRRKLV